MEVLLVEDNEADRRAMKEAFSAVCGEVTLRMAEDGEKVAQMVANKGEFAGTPPVNLVLLDLNLPGASGQNVLRELKTNPETRKVPVIIFTSSTFQDDVKKCYELGANCYINKPMRYSELLKLVGQLNDFWLKQVCYA